MIGKMEILTTDLKQKFDRITAQYEQKRAALLPVLHLIQNTHGFISESVELEVADYFQIPPVDLREIITFYTLFRSKPCAKYQFNLCRTLSCTITGGREISNYLKEKLGIQTGEVTPDGKFGFNEVECLGACEIAPMAEFNQKFIGSLTKEKIDQILNDVK